MRSISLDDKVEAIEAKELIAAFKQLYANTSIRVIEIAMYLQYSERTLRRRTRQYFDSSPIELLQKIRLNQATCLLMAGVKSGQVWHQVGFSSHSYFSDLFKAHYGVMPSEYR
jgi:transcriptional regulator GlxA family with amidase domain